MGRLYLRPALYGPCVHTYVHIRSWSIIYNYNNTYWTVHNKGAQSSSIITVYPILFQRSKRMHAQLSHYPVLRRSSENALLVNTTITADLKLLSFLVLILSRIFLISTLLTLLLLSNKFWYNYENINIIVNYIKSQ